MTNNLFIYNTLTRSKERFEPLHPPRVGLYACGPTVYGEAHLGHARQAITFDVLYRYLVHLGYKVRYVRNITDVGHLEDDADEGEDKVLKQARLESLEPMEVVQNYMNRYHRNMRQLNVLEPSIEPRASGHIFEQQELIRKILDAGFAYVADGSVYFDVEKYHRDHSYGILSGRKIDELRSNTRNLDGQSEKRSPLDFALWKKADKLHIMRWPSEWGEGFPGWHLECSAMSTRYLGSEFDIHGGGMDLLFPHHECEIAQNQAARGNPAVRYWMHNNMITVNGRKMGRSLRNFITLDQCFSGKHAMLDGPYDPMTIRFFILQAHYRGTLDFSNEALQAAKKGLDRLLKAVEQLDAITESGSSSLEVTNLAGECRAAMEDDLNTPVLLSCLFDGVKWINGLAEGSQTIDRKGLEALRSLYRTYLNEILGIYATPSADPVREVTTGLVELVLKMRNEARENQDFKQADRLRDELADLGITVKDRKDGADWEIR